MGNLNALTHDEQIVRVPVNSRLYVKAATQGTLHGQQKCEKADNPLIHSCVTTDVCVNVISFIPQPGMTYVISHELSIEGCTISLVDDVEKKQPDSILIHEVKGECKPYSAAE
jgi:hypothetical protein